MFFFFLIVFLNVASKSFVICQTDVTDASRTKKYNYLDGIHHATFKRRGKVIFWEEEELKNYFRPEIC